MDVPDASRSIAGATAQEPPAAVEAVTRPLYLAWQVGVVAWLLGALGGSIVLAVNARRLGRPGAAAAALLVGLATPFAALVMLGATYEPMMIVGVLCAGIGAIVVGALVQGPAVRRALAAGAPRGTLAHAAAWAAIGLVIVGVAGVAVAMLLAPFPVVAPVR